ncbi:MAG: GNAT family N-acetyltransferase, partial [Candidatus Poribacteria bacterium]|nr:GNAT family N-acetyltransferase [Candidatus Poribacteria bacterium]
MKQDRTQELPVTIRSAVQDDAEIVARIYIDSWNSGFGELLSRANRTVTSDLIERWRGDLVQPTPHRWWVAEYTGAIVGFAGICPSRDPVDVQLGELDTIAVDPPYWRACIGKALMEFAQHFLRVDGYGEAILWTVDGYEQGIAFYEAMGWR